jgi:hypothetical protein
VNNAKQENEKDKDGISITEIEPFKLLLGARSVTRIFFHTFKKRGGFDYKE